MKMRNTNKYIELISILDLYTNNTDVSYKIEDWYDSPSGWSGQDLIIKTSDGFEFRIHSNRESTDIDECIRQLKLFYEVAKVNDYTSLLDYIKNKYGENND